MTWRVARVERHAAVREHTLRPPAVAAQHRADAGVQFVEFEGLDEVVVGADIEAAHLVAGAVARGQHDHRRAVLARTQCAQQVQAVSVRRRIARLAQRAAGGQAEVEQHEVEAFARERGVRGGEVAHPVDRMAFEAQRGAQRVADHSVVFDEEQAHQRVRWPGAQRA